MNKIANGERIDKAINKSYKEYGKNRIFLTGNNLNDLFLWNIREGVYNLVTSLKNYAKENNFTWFIWQKDNDEREYYRLEEKKWIRKEFRDLNEVRMGSMAGKMLKKESNSKTENDDMPVENVELESILSALINEDKYKRDEIFLFIENFDWLAKFYEEQQNTVLIKKIKNLEKLKKHLVIISSKQLETLKNKYFEEYDEKEEVNIGRPSKNEIEITLHRILWKSIGYSPDKLDVNELATNFSNTKCTLLEAIRVLKKKLKDYKEDISMSNFEFNHVVSEKIFLKDVIMSNDDKSRIKEIILHFKEEEKPTKKGMILTGPPGTGKTYLAKALSNEIGLYFMCPKLSDLKGQYVGQSAIKIREMFEEARQNEPTLIFLDEIDTLFPLRDNGDGDSYTKDMTNEFLQQLDGVNTGKQKIFVLSATNRIDSIDSAVRSRLGEGIEISLPDSDSREALFKINLKEQFSEEDWESLTEDNKYDLLERSAKMSGRDIKSFCSEVLKEDIKVQKCNDFNSIYEKIFSKIFDNRKNAIIEDLKRTTGLECKIGKEIREEKLFGVEHEKKQIENFVKQMKETAEEAQKRKKWNIVRQNGIILYGPPGNGKTELINQIARKENAILIKIESKHILGHSTTETIRNIDKIFDKAILLSKICNENEGVILFFDEFDAICGVNMNNSIRGTLLCKLTEKEGIRAENAKIIIAAATNNYMELDPAIIRKGRFDLHILIDNPEEDVAKNLIRSLFISEKIIVENEKLLDDFYEIIKEAEIHRSNKRNNYVEENNENYTISSAFIRNAVEEIKRFIFLNSNKSNENELRISEYLLKKCKKEVSF